MATHKAQIALALVVACYVATSRNVRADNAKWPILTIASDAIRAQEKQVNNLVAEGTAAFYIINKQNEWVPYGQADAIGTYEAVPGGKRRLDCKNSLVPWMDGRSPFVRQVYVSVFNGRTGMTYFTMNDDYTKPAKVSETFVTGGMPQECIGTRAVDATGWHFSIFGGAEIGARAAIKKEQTFSDFVADSPWIDVQTIAVNNRKYLCLTKMDDKVKEKYYLDINRGYTWARYERYGYLVAKDVYTDDDPTYLTGGWHASDFYETAKGIFYPKHLDFQGSRLKKRPVEKGTVDIKSVSINVPAVSDSTFTLKPPDGATALVQNQNGTTYTWHNGKAVPDPVPPPTPAMTEVPMQMIKSVAGDVVDVSLVAILVIVLSAGVYWLRRKRTA